MRALQEFLESEGYEFTWETQCMECGEDFRCEKYLPAKIIRKVLEDKHDDCVHEFIGDSSNSKFMHCPKCRKELGED